MSGTQLNTEWVEAVMDALAESLFCQPKGELKGYEYSDVFDASKSVLSAVLPLIVRDAKATALREAADEIKVCTCGEGNGRLCENCLWTNWLLDRADAVGASDEGNER